MNRRRFLSWLGLAPVALPAAAKAAFAPVRAGGYGAMIGDWSSHIGVAIFDPQAAMFMPPVREAGWDKSLAIERAAESQLGDFPLHRVIPGNLSAGIPTRLVCIPGDAAMLLIDDVGSGP